MIDARTTEVLLRRAQDGDERALADLFDRYRDRIERLARADVGPRLASKVHIEDIVQEVRVRAWKELGSFDPRHAPRLICWLGAIMRNCIRDELHKWSAEARNPDREVDLVALRGANDSVAFIPIPSNEPTPSQNAVAQELTLIFDECVHSLSERHREVVLLRQYADMSWQDIATRIGSPSAKAAFQLHERAMEALTEKLRLAGISLPTDSAS